MIEISLPASKSIYNRALIINALNERSSVLIAGDLSDDSTILEQQIEAYFKQSFAINIGEAGTSMRFMTAFLAQADNTYFLFGKGRILERPIASLINALEEIGAKITYLENDGFLPIKIDGRKLEGGNVAIDGSISSQFISALMLIAPKLENGLHITIENDMVSFPYILLTKRVLNDFGVLVEINKNEISIKPQKFDMPMIYFVESDWSSAAFWYQILCLNPSINQLKLSNLSFSGYQGDEIVANVFEQLGIESVAENNNIILNKTNVTLPEFIDIDLTDAPDLAPALVVTFALLKIKSEIRGLITLNKKESERIKVLRQELEKLGVIIHSTDDMIQLLGFADGKPENVMIEVHGDHRIEMAFAPLLFIGKGNGVENAQTVSKSYPQFWQEFEKILKHTKWED